MENPSDWSESRLTGKLALDPGSTVESLLVVSLATKQVLFNRNVNDPTSAAVASFDAWTASAKLSAGDEQAGAEPVMLKVYKNNTEETKNSYKTIYSDGTYLLCADVSTAAAPPSPPPGLVDA